MAEGRAGSAEPVAAAGRRGMCLSGPGRSLGSNARVFPPKAPCCRVRCPVRVCARVVSVPLRRFVFRCLLPVSVARVRVEWCVVCSS